MSDIAIRVENLSKKYKIGRAQQRHDTLRDALVDAGSRLGEIFRRDGANGHTDDTFWALKDVSFEVKRGEVVGIIGRNGAGKSTLLKILSQITEPTSGRAEIHGRVGSLLEVGTGFHPELTGRENVFLNGAILGMRREEIQRQFDEIVAFAEIEKFLDTPVKRYSSGMYVRLAFAVAAHLEPEILLVDEVLAVGDAQFQKKALGKMGNVVKEGRTVMFVSHNMTAVASLCPRGVLLEHGMIRSVGHSQQVIDEYLSSSWQPRSSQTWESTHVAPGTAEVRIQHISVDPTDGRNSDFLTVETPLTVTFRFWVLQTLSVNLSMHVKQMSGETVYAVISPIVDVGAGLATFRCDIPGNFMNDGIYSIHMMIVHDSTPLFVLEEGVIFEIHDVDRKGNWWGKWPGAVRPKLHWEYTLEHLAEV